MIELAIMLGVPVLVLAGIGCFGYLCNGRNDK